jgi:predicted transposase/invertase (TIGR01784 family)
MFCYIKIINAGSIMSKMDRHDLTFTYCMHNKLIAKQFFKEHLPKDVLKCINLQTLTLQKNNHIDVKLRKSITDVVYGVNMRDEIGYLYLLIDHKSAPEPFVALQLMRYTLALMQDHLKKYKTTVLPLVYPIIFYHGKTSPYPYPRSLGELFIKEYQDKGKAYLVEPIHIVDVGQIPDKTLREHKWAGLMSFVLKHRHSKDLASKLGLMKETFCELVELGENELFEVLLNYMLNTADQHQCDNIIEAMQAMSKKVGDITMTAAEMLTNRGRQEGRQEGQIIAKQQLAKRMLDAGLSLEQVEEISGFSRDVLSQMQK